MGKRKPQTTEEFHLGELQQMRDLLVRSLAIVDDAIKWEMETGRTLAAFNKSMFRKAMSGLHSFSPRLEDSVANANRGIVFPPGMMIGDIEDFIRTGPGTNKPLAKIPSVQSKRKESARERRIRETEEELDAVSKKVTARGKPTGGSTSKTSKMRKSG